MKTPAILYTLMNTYKKANDNGDAYNTVKACIFHNNEPVNVLKAVKVLKDIKCLERLDLVYPVCFEVCLRYLSEITGYSTIELYERLTIV
jgi:hypothetical protein